MTVVTSAQLLPTDYSEEAWSSLWNQVGPVETPPFNYTVSPTPEPSHPAPPLGLPTKVTHANNSAYQLPKDFVWGLCSAAYQVEGAVKEEGRGPSLWDLLSHRVPNWVADGLTGDITDLEYYLYPQDILRLQSFGIPYFYMSIAWSRIFPFGRGYVNEQGLRHYDDVIQRLVDAGIKPVIALYHWDTPLALMNEYNGWVSEQIVQDFLAYAQVVITRWDKYVPIWITVNEPQVYCSDYAAYPSGYWNQFGITGQRAIYYCGHNTLLAHSEVVSWYRHVFNGTGRITFKNAADNFIANTSSSADAEAVARGNDFQLGWFNSPTWTTGDYPASMRETLGDFLQNFTAKQSKMVLGSCDFFALDGYTTSVIGAIPGNISSCATNSSHPYWPSCIMESQTTASGWLVGYAAGNSHHASWLKAVPSGLRMILNYLQKTYVGPAHKDIMLTESGFAESFEENFTTLADRRWDIQRVNYFDAYLNNLLAARVDDGVNVIGALAWGVYDNFEWQNGLGTRFGLQTVNYTLLERHPEVSLFTFVDFFKQHSL
ncbi:glycoside hydrolase family 1 protein [Acidomyces richmondensis BFW]|nr:glycoside hydrolase family 1 protein [Acidomyces richmondensis BFW]